MPMTTPPLAVPSSFASTMPVTPSASWNWRALARLGHDALHLLQLLHERRLRVQAAGRVAQDDVHALRRALLHRLEADAGGIGSLLAAHHRRAHALRPDLELLARGRAERVAGAEQHRVARLLHLGRELADGRGLAAPVHAHHHDHVRPLRAHREPLILAGETVEREDALDVPSQDGPEAARVGELVLPGPLARGGEQPG